LFIDLFLYRFETSAKSDQNIDKAMDVLIQHIINAVSGDGTNIIPQREGFQLRNELHHGKGIGEDEESSCCIGGSQKPAKPTVRKIV
jgi:hypothetical protein